ncbi:MAG: hypothetical protein JNL07_05515, partial [Rhodospirillales bacterium]|nr:hypothetical protein [Rhodospirillales bacterium]
DILDDGFLDRRSSGASSYLLYFTAGGLAVHAMGWPFAAAVCYMGYEPNPVVIPYADLRPLATPAHPYADIR